MSSTCHLFKCMKRSCVLKATQKGFHWGKASSVFKLATNYVGDAESITSRKKAIAVVLDNMNEEQLYEQYCVLTNGEVNEVLKHSPTSAVKEAILRRLKHCYNDENDRNSWLAEGVDFKNLVDSCLEVFTDSFDMKKQYFPNQRGPKAIGTWMKTVVKGVKVDNIFYSSNLAFFVKCAEKGAFHMFKPEHAQFFMDCCEEHNSGTIEVTNLKLVFQKVIDTFDKKLEDDNLGNWQLMKNVDVNQTEEQCCSPASPGASTVKRTIATVTPVADEKRRKVTSAFGNGGTYVCNNEDNENGSLKTTVQDHKDKKKDRTTKTNDGNDKDKNKDSAMVSK